MINIKAPSNRNPLKHLSTRHCGAALCLTLMLGVTQSAQAVDGVGLYDTVNGDFRLVESNGRPLKVFRIGRKTGRLPIAGNWDGARGAGRAGDTVGLYKPRNGKFMLRNSNTTGPADLVIRFGGRRRFGWIPLAGDWTGRGRDSIGLYDPRSSTFRLRKTLKEKSRKIVFRLGDVGLDLVPIVGDWDQDGVDTVGLYDSINGVFFLTNSNREGRGDFVTVSVRDRTADVFPVSGSNRSGLDRSANVFPVSGLNRSSFDRSGDVFPISGREVPAEFLDFSSREENLDIVVRFGEQGLGWRPVAGNWTVSFFDSVGLFDPFRNEFLLRFTNTSGPPNRVIRFPGRRSGRTQIPLAGNWRR